MARSNKHKTKGTAASWPAFLRGSTALADCVTLFNCHQRCRARCALTRPRRMGSSRRRRPTPSCGATCRALGSPTSTTRLPRRSAGSRPTTPPRAPRAHVPCLRGGRQTFCLGPLGVGPTRLRVCRVQAAVATTDIHQRVMGAPEHWVLIRFWALCEATVSATGWCVGGGCILRQGFPLPHGCLLCLCSTGSEAECIKCFPFPFVPTDR